MPEGLTPGLIDGLSIVGVVILIGIGFATGRLYTKAQVVEMQDRHTAEITRMEASYTRELDDANHERGEWRTEARLNQQTIVELTEQNRAMLTAFGPTLTDFLDGFRRAADEVLRGDKA